MVIMDKMIKETCENCAYSSPARPPYRRDFVRCNEKETDFGKSHDIVYVVKKAICNIFKQILM
jgi:hypothetical protein